MRLGKVCGYTTLLQFLSCLQKTQLRLWFWMLYDGGLENQKTKTGLSSSDQKLLAHRKCFFKVVQSWNESASSWDKKRYLKKNRVTISNNRRKFLIKGMPDNSNLEKIMPKNHLLSVQKSKTKFSAPPPRIERKEGGDYYPKKQRISAAYHLGLDTLETNRKLLNEKVENGEIKRGTRKYTRLEEQRLENVLKKTGLVDEDALAILGIFEEDPNYNVDQLVDLIYDLHNLEKSQRRGIKIKKREKRNEKRKSAKKLPYSTSIFNRQKIDVRNKPVRNKSKKLNSCLIS